MHGGGALLDGIDLDVAAGEIVAIAGVAGNGQQALAGLLSERSPPERGSVTLAGPRARRNAARMDRRAGRREFRRIGTPSA